MITARLVILLLALVAFLGAALGVVSRVNLVAAGLFLVTLAALLYRTL